MCVMVVVVSGFGSLPASGRICLVCDPHAVFSEGKDYFLPAQCSGAILGANKLEKQFCLEIRGLEPRATHTVPKFSTPELDCQSLAS